MKERFKITLQHDQTDCGIACLLSIIQHHGGEDSQENLRLLSGTSVIGTTLLGLYQCAKQVGFDTDGVQMDLDHLSRQQLPCILHVIVDERLEHYIVYYGCITKKGNKGREFIIGDPAKGIIRLSEDELDVIWKSKTALLLTPNAEFKKLEQHKQAKWRLFKNIIKEDINILLITIFIGAVIAALGLATAIFSQKLIDKILPSHKITSLYIGLVLLLFILIVRALLMYLRQHFLLLQSRDFNKRIAGSFFKTLLFLPKSFFDNRKTGDMTARLNDVLRIQNNIAYVAGSVCIDILVSIISAAFIIFYSLQIAALTFAFIPVIIFVTLKFVKPLQFKQREVMIAYAFNESNYIDSIKGINAIKGSNLEGGFSEINREVFSTFQNKYFDLGKTGNRFTIISELIAAVLTIVVILMTSLMVLKHQLKIGEMIAVIAMVSTLIPAVSRLSQINLQIQEARIAFDRMYEFVSIKPEYEPQEQKQQPVNIENIKFCDIGFRFPGRKAILQNINLEFNKGQLTALIGESGSGKTTTFQLLQKFYHPEKGSILINGANLDDIDTDNWRRVTASVFQDINLFTGSLLWNIALDTSPERLHEVFQYCESMGFGQFFNEFAQGYNTLIGEGGINLSGGQKQLVALARALCRKPQLLLLDEVTSAMDRNMEGFVMGLLSRLKQNMAIVFVTHRFHTIKFSDQIYIIENGIVHDFGRHAELMVNDNLYSRYVNDLIL
jgi:ABC-type bacteriocin/lantibiotic exporter with double-glycine peptidase domain